MNNLIDRTELLRKLNNTSASITFDLPVEELLGDVDMGAFAMLLQDAIQAYRKMVIDTIRNMPAEENKACKSEYEGLRGVPKTLGGLGDARFYEKK